MDLHYPHLRRGSGPPPHKTPDAPVYTASDSLEESSVKEYNVCEPQCLLKSFKSSILISGHLNDLSSIGHGFHLQVVILEFLRKSLLLPHFQSSTALLLFLGIGQKVIVSASELVSDFAFPIMCLLCPRRNLLNASRTIASSA